MAVAQLGIGPRIAGLLRKKYPRNTAKEAARRFKTSPKNVERWLSGKAPTPAFIEEMTMEWGSEFIEDVFTEAVQAHDDRVAKVRRILITYQPLRAVTLDESSSDGLGAMRTIVPAPTAEQSQLVLPGRKKGKWRKVLTAGLGPFRPAFETLRWWGNEFRYRIDTLRTPKVPERRELHTLLVALLKSFESTQRG